MIMEHDIGVNIFARYCQRPQFLHKENLVGEFRHFGVLTSSLHYPVSKMSDKVEEEVALRDADYCKYIHSEWKKQKILVRLCLTRSRH